MRLLRSWWGRHLRPTGKAPANRQSFTAFIQVARPGSNQGNFIVTFVGGEPLMYPEGMQLVAEHVQEIAQQRGIQTRFRVVTNGTLF